MSEAFSGTLAKYEVNVGDGRTVTMQGDVEALDKIIHQMKTWQPVYEALLLVANGHIKPGAPKAVHDAIQAALNAAKSTNDPKIYGVVVCPICTASDGMHYSTCPRWHDRVAAANGTEATDDHQE